MRDHSHETLIEVVRAKSGEVVEPEPFNPRVFEELFGIGEVMEMDMDYMNYMEVQLAGEEQPFDTIDLTGEDDNDSNDGNSDDD